MKFMSPFLFFSILLGLNLLAVPQARADGYALSFNPNGSSVAPIIIHAAKKQAPDVQQGQTVAVNAANSSPVNSAAGPVAAGGGGGASGGGAAGTASSQTAVKAAAADSLAAQTRVASANANVVAQAQFLKAAAATDAAVKAKAASDAAAAAVAAAVKTDAVATQAAAVKASADAAAKAKAAQDSLAAAQAAKAAADKAAAVTLAAKIEADRLAALALADAKAKADRAAAAAQAAAQAKAEQEALAAAAAKAKAEQDAIRLAQQRGLNDVPQAILNKLDNGVNITRWFGYRTNPHDPALTTYFTAADFQNLQSLNVHFVRLAIFPQLIMQADGTPNPIVLDRLEAAIQKFEQLGILVDVDLHDSHNYLQLDTPGHDNSKFVKFWIQTAEYFKGKHKNTMFFELVNEPGFNAVQLGLPAGALADATVWHALQINTVNAIRAVDPDRTIMVAGTNGGWIDWLTGMPILKQKNLIYTFHFYEPFAVTHQCAPWVDNDVKYLKGIPFPFNVADGPAVAALNPQYQDLVLTYSKKLYNETFLRKRLNVVNDWAKTNQVPLVMGEFGMMPDCAPAGARLNWFNAVHAIVADLKMPYAIWAYDDALGLGRNPLNANSAANLDAVALKSVYGVSSTLTPVQ